jgi:hypothetical protein
VVAEIRFANAAGKRGREASFGVPGTLKAKKEKVW